MGIGDGASLDGESGRRIFRHLVAETLWRRSSRHSRLQLFVHIFRDSLLILCGNIIFKQMRDIIPHEQVVRGCREDMGMNAHWCFLQGLK